MNDRKKALMRVQTYGFALDEVVLFLDTHPDNASALEYYHKTLALYNAAVKEYVTNYGPLENTQVQSSKNWSWATDRMPWEDDDDVEI